MPFSTTPAGSSQGLLTRLRSKRTKHSKGSSQVNLTNSEFLQTIRENWAFAQYTLRRNQVEALLNDPLVLKLDIRTIDAIVKIVEGK